MRLFNGLSAFGGLLILTFIVSRSLAAMPVCETLLYWQVMLVWHLLWYLNTILKVPLVLRVVAAPPLCCVLSFLGASCYGLAALITCNVPLLTIFTVFAAIVDIVYCLIKIEASLPQSLNSRSRLIVALPSAAPIALPVDAKTTVDQ
jgi:hypothetical protein